MSHSRFTINALEPRRLLADIVGSTADGLADAGPGFDPGAAPVTVGRAPMTFDEETGTLTVYGSPGDDTISPVLRGGRSRLSFDLARPAYAPGTVVIYDGTAEGLAGLPIGTLGNDDLPRLSDVKKIVIYAGEGNDTIRLAGLKVPCEVHGGAGNDTIAGSQANDTLYGEAGNDEISDGRGNDLLAGGAGRDLLRALKGPDTLLGQNGNDRLFSNTDEDVVSGGAGTLDTAYLTATPDAVSGVERYGSTSRRPAADLSGQAGSITLARTARGGLAVTADLTLRGTRYALDWDLVQTRTGLEAVATPYLIDPTLATSLQLDSNFSQTFNVERDLSNANVLLALRVGGNTVVRGRVAVDDQFETQTLSRA